MPLLNHLLSRELEIMLRTIACACLVRAFYRLSISEIVSSPRQSPLYIAIQSETIWLISVITLIWNISEITKGLIWNLCHVSNPSHSNLDSVRNTMVRLSTFAVYYLLKLMFALLLDNNIVLYTV